MVNALSHNRYITAMNTTNDQPERLCTLNMAMMIAPVSTAPISIHGRNLPNFICEPSIIAPIMGSFTASQIRPPTPISRLIVVNCTMDSVMPNCM